LLLADGRTDRYDEANSRSSQFCAGIIYGNWDKWLEVGISCVMSSLVLYIGKYMWLMYCFLKIYVFMFSFFIKAVSQSTIVGLLIMVRVPQFENRLINGYKNKY